MIEKIKEMKSLMIDEDILANIFLNYSSYKNNDIIFLLKKQFSIKLRIEIKDIKLIGSGHIGFGIDINKSTITKKNVGDLDFVIINNDFFIKIYEKIKNNNYIKIGNRLKYKMNKDQKIPTFEEAFNKNYKNDKLHLRYVTPDFFILKICKEVDKYLENNFGINLKTSCCIYKNEKAFLKNQNRYYLSFLKNLKLEENKEEKTEKAYGY